MSRHDQLMAVLPRDFESLEPVLDRLTSFTDLVLRWNPAINMVAKSTVADLWDRHIVDSAQIFRFADQSTKIWLDIGSGGGFPGIVCAVLAQVALPDLRFFLVEADQRKATFLRQVVRLMDLTMVDVVCDRAERLKPVNASVVSARALASLTELCGLAHQHLAEGGIAVFLKGRQSEDEIVKARLSWQFAVERFPSATSAESAVLALKELRHV